MWKCLFRSRRMGRRWVLRRGLLRTRTVYECIIHCIQLVRTKLRRINSRVNFVSVFYAYKFLFLSNILKSIRKQIRIKIKHISAHLNHSDKAPITHIISIDLRSGVTNTSNCYRTFHYIVRRFIEKVCLVSNKVVRLWFAACFSCRNLCHTLNHID